MSRVYNVLENRDAVNLIRNPIVDDILIRQRAHFSNTQTMLSLHLITVVFFTFASFSFSTSTPYSLEANGLEWVYSNWKNLSYIEHKIPGGYELNGEPLYICRVGDGVLGNGWSFPGRLSLIEQICTIRGVKWALLLTGYFQVLTNPKGRYLKWSHHKDGDLPPNAVEAARFIDPDEISYVSRNSSDGWGRQIQPGEMYKPYKAALFAFRIQYTYTNAYITDTKWMVPQSPVYEVLSVVPPNGFQQLSESMLHESSGFIWVNADYKTLGKVADKLLVGTVKRAESYVCRVVDPNENDEGALYPGTVSSKTGVCYVKKENENFAYLSRYQVLTNPKKLKIQWTEDKDGNLNPEKAVFGGKSKNGDNYYIGRTQKDNPEGVIAGRISLKEKNFVFCDINEEPAPNMFYYQSPIEESPKCKTLTKYDFLAIT